VYICGPVKTSAICSGPAAAERKLSRPWKRIGSGRAFRGFEVSTWLGFVAPRGTPADIVTAMAHATQEVLRLPDVAARLAALGAIPVGSTPEEFAAVLRKDRAFMPTPSAPRGFR